MPGMLRAVEIDGRTRVVALLGHPVEHTRSPLIHNAAFEAQGLNYRYVACNVEPDLLEQAVRGLVALNFLGANVTIPHKQAVLPLLDEISPQALAVGAVNTISIRGSGSERRLHGDNTDIAGFLTPLTPYVEEVRRSPALVFGCGGAARAVVYGIAHVLRPPALYVAARKPEAAEEMMSEILQSEATPIEYQVVSMADAAPLLSQSALIVNCTPLGMHPNEDSSPWDSTDEFRPGQVVYDLVYNPLETKLLRLAASRGATVIGGLEMLIQQASASYRQWTGRQMPVDAVRDVLAHQPEDSL